MIFASPNNSCKTLVGYDKKILDYQELDAQYLAVSTHVQIIVIS